MHQNEDRVTESKLILKFLLIDQNNEYHCVTKKARIVKNDIIVMMISTKSINNKSIQSSVTSVSDCTEKCCHCKHFMTVDAEDVDDH